MARRDGEACILGCGGAVTATHYGEVHGLKLSDYAGLAEEEISKLKRDLAALEKERDRLRSENARLTGEVRSLIFENQQIRVGAKVSDELRQTYDDLYTKGR